MAAPFVTQPSRFSTVRSLKSWAAEGSAQGAAELCWASIPVQGQPGRPQLSQAIAKDSQAACKDFPAWHCPGVGIQLWEPRQAQCSHLESVLSPNVCGCIHTEAAATQTVLGVSSTSLGNCLGGNPSFLHLQRCFPSGRAVHWLQQSLPFTLPKGGSGDNLGPELSDNLCTGVQQGPHLSHFYHHENPCCFTLDHRSTRSWLPLGKLDKH